MTLPKRQRVSIRKLQIKIPPKSPEIVKIQSNTKKIENKCLL